MTVSTRNSAALADKLNHIYCIQGAYNSGKPGKLGEFVNSGKLREFKVYSGNLSDVCCFFFVTQSETHKKMT